MRYAYENLLNLQFKNTQPFDLNYYSDFLDFHFTNDKIILMKNFIEHDYFLISIEQKDIKPLYEFFVKSLNNNLSLGFIESFKMKYFIYPLTIFYCNDFSNI